LGCFLVLFALISPRLALVFVWLFSNLLDRAYDEWWLPLLGFFILPWTTLAYAVMWSSGTNEVTGFEWFIVGFAFIADISSWGNSGRLDRR
jgi:hypothetical protein